MLPTKEQRDQAVTLIQEAQSLIGQTIDKVREARAIGRGIGDGPFCGYLEQLSKVTAYLRPLWLTKSGDGSPSLLQAVASCKVQDESPAITEASKALSESGDTIAVPKFSTTTTPASDDSDEDDGF